MIKLTYNQLKERETIDDLINYEQNENIIGQYGLWVCGIISSKVVKWETTTMICLRLFNKENKNIGGINLFPGQILCINVNGMITIIGGK